MPEEDSYTFYNNCFQGLAKFAEDHKNYLCAKELYLRAGNLYNSYQMKKKQKTLYEKQREMKDYQKNSKKEYLINDVTPNKE